MAMTPRWKDICCASIPVHDLPVLADLRRLPEIRVSILEDRAWICWEAESESTRQVLVERLLPLSGVEMFARRGGHWYRPGESLPAFRVPIGDGSGGVPLERVMFPRPMTASVPANGRAGTDRAPTGARRAESAPAGRRGVLPARSAGRVGRAGDLGSDCVADGDLDRRPGRRAGVRPRCWCSARPGCSRHRWADRGSGAWT